MRKGVVHKDLTGEVIGDLTIVGFSHFIGDRSYWLARCICGNEVVALRNNLQQRRAQSCGCRRRKKIGRTAFQCLFGNYKIQAKARGLEFTLTEDQFRELTQRPCLYCGSVLSNTCTRPSGSLFKYNGIDRFDNQLGYTYDNSVPCCVNCNRMKRGMSAGEFFLHVERIYGTISLKLSLEKHDG